MSRKDTRTTRLRALCEVEGGYAEVARVAGISADNLWQILNGTPLPSGNPRGLGDKLADKIERAFYKPAGWLDGIDGDTSVHQVKQPVAQYNTRSDWPFAVDRSRFDRLSTPDKTKIGEYIELLVMKDENTRHEAAPGASAA